MLNPGPSYVLKHSDVCFYMNIAKEENSTFLPATSSVSASHSTMSTNQPTTNLAQQLLPLQQLNTGNKNDDEDENNDKDQVAKDADADDGKVCFLSPKCDQNCNFQL